MGCREIEGDTLIKSVAHGIEKAGKGGATRAERFSGKRLDEALDCATGEPHHTDAAPAGGGGDGDNGVAMRGHAAPL